MAFIDSSVGQSPLADLGEMPDDELNLEAEEAPQDEDEPERAPLEREFEGTDAQFLAEQIDDINLARYIDQQRLDQIGMQVVEEFRIDENSRKDWADKTEKAMKFATQTPKEKSFPWPKASNVILPILSQCALEFQARAYPALIPNKKVVKGCVWGADDGTPAKDEKGDPLFRVEPGKEPQPQWLIEPGEKRVRADRIGDHMSYQLLEEMADWEEQTDQALFQAPIAGGFVRKSFHDPVEKANVSLVVDLMNLVWNYHAPSFTAAPRHTEKFLAYPYEIVENERKGQEGDQPGMWLHYEYAGGGGSDGTKYGYDETPPGADQGDESAPHMFIEQHRRLDLDEDGYPEPYIVTVHLRSMKVVRIVALYDEDGIEENEDGQVRAVRLEQQYTLYGFLPNLEGGSYPMGFGHLLKPLNEAANTTVNQMLDAGTLQNAGGGFISDQLNAPSGQTLFQVGKFHRVTTKGQSIRDAVLPLPFQGPNATLFQLLGLLVEAAKSMGSIQNVLTGDAAIANAPPTTVLALIEQGVKVYTSIYKRLWRAMKSELAKLYRLNRKHLDKTARYKVEDEWLEVSKEDYSLGGGVVPVADPTMTTDMQKLARAQVLLQFNGDPLIDQVEIRRRLFEAADLERINDLFAKPDAQQQQIAQQQMQREMMRLEAEIDRATAAALKDQTQAFLNLAKARTEVQGEHLAFVEHQLSLMRLQIEATNASTRAAEVDHRFQDTAAWERVETNKVRSKAIGDGVREYGEAAE